MIKTIEHRGPNGEGVFYDQKVALGHKRLSIIDLASGMQPMHSSCNRYVIVFNGEIYNYKKIKEELLNCNVQFNSNSDTEVLLNAYKVWKEDCLSRLNGMFAFAIYDKQEKKLFLARDRFGVKPLYIFQNSKVTLFASEIKAILQHPDYQKNININSISEYITLRYCLNGESFYEGIKQFPPAHFANIVSNTIQLKKYWNLEKVETKLSFNESVEFIHEEIKKAVKYCTVSDVKVGAFLSGGVDSSLVVANKPNIDFHTVTAIFDNSFEKNEQNEARAISNYFKTIHHELLINPDSLITDLPKMIWHRDGPLEVPNELAIYQLSHYIKDKFTVVLSGEGADEAFLGYHNFSHTQKRWNQYQVIKKLNTASFGALKSIIIPHVNNNSLNKLLSLKFNNRNEEISCFLSLIHLGQDFERSIFKDSKLSTHANNHLKWHIEELAKTSETNFLNTILKFDQATHMQSLLNRMDLMSMAASIESRVPFLDHNLFQAAWNLPLSCKYQNGQNKIILKEVLKKSVPKNLIQKKKIGFELPHSLWLNSTKFKDFVNDSLLSSNNKVSQFFSQDVISKIISNALNESSDPLYKEYVWRLLNLEIWLQGGNP